MASSSWPAGVGPRADSALSRSESGGPSSSVNPERLTAREPENVRVAELSLAPAAWSSLTPCRPGEPQHFDRRVVALDVLGRQRFEGRGVAQGATGVPGD